MDDRARYIVLPLALRQSISATEKVDVLSDIYCHNILTAKKDRLLHFGILVPGSSLYTLHQEFGRDMNNDNDLFHAFYTACTPANDCIEIVKFLLACGADTNNRYKSSTPIHLAYDYSNAEIGTKVVKLLLENNADVNVPDHYGYSII